MFHVDEQKLGTEQRKQARKKAIGVDGIDETAYDEKAEKNIRELVKKLKKLQHKPRQVRRTNIPKEME